MKLHIKNVMLVITTMITAALSTAAHSSALNSNIMAASPQMSEFKAPSNPYLPRTWMHVMCGNLSKEGFTKDFEALADAGIGGALVFHIDRGIPCGPKKFGSEAFNDVLTHAAVEADRVGIEMGLHNCDGWSSSGGPWVTPAQSMKQIVYSEVVSAGGDQELSFPQLPQSNHYAEDVAVLAWPISSDIAQFKTIHPQLSSSHEQTDIQPLLSHNLDREVLIKPDATGEHWLQASYPNQVTVKSVLTEQRSRHGKGELWVSNDGKKFNKVAAFDQFRLGKHLWSFENSFGNGITAKHFRLKFDRSFKIRKFELSALPKVQKWQIRNAIAKGALGLDLNFPQKAVINPDQLLVLHRGQLNNNKLAVHLPAGDWFITRYGFTTTAAHNHPASKEGRGLEIDKLDAKAMDHHFEQYVAKVVTKAKKQGSDALLYSEIDSFEMGGNNWTHDLDKKFQHRWGYDFIKWLPTLNGHVIESTTTSDAVLTDFRDLVADLMTQNYFQRFADLLHKHGMKSYVEPYGLGTLNELAVGGTADKTMGEFWVVPEGFKGVFDAAVSSARVYGKNVISAESFTAWSAVNWRGHPYSMKIFGDHAWASGVNETMFHRYAHQPNTHVVPGMTMGSVGSHIDRTQTWWRNAGKAWFKYLARGSYLLQQGNPASDFLVFLGDTRPLKTMNWHHINLPAGVRGDYVNSDVLINRVQVKNGKLVLPEGTSYNALYIHQGEQLRLETLQRIEELVRAGAVIVAEPPKEPIGYIEKKQHAKTFKAIVNKVWADNKQPQAYGKGYVIPYKKPAEALAYLGLGADLLINGEGAKYFTHRSTKDGELYFFFNETKDYKTMDVDFRAHGLTPEVWDADSGHVERIKKYNKTDKRTQFSLTLEPHGSRFVFFRKAKQNPQYAGSKLALLNTLGINDNDKPSDVLPLDLDWQVTFDKAWGGPGTILMQKLQDWTEHKEEGVRHFSGTAIYRSEFELPKSWASNALVSNALTSNNKPVVLDLGHVNIAAEITINGTVFPTLWKPPFAHNVISALKTGKNTIQVAVTNVWTNRLIGDEALPKVDGYHNKKPMPQWFIDNKPAPKGQRYTWTSWNFYGKKSQRTLEPSGLYGPVRLVR